MRRVLFTLLGLGCIALGDARGDGASAVFGATLLRGAQARFFIDQSVGGFRVYAFRDGAPVPIPFQVDERDHRNRWAIDRGPHPSHDKTPGVYDENDAVVFPNRHLGSRGDAALLPRGAKIWGEVQIGSDAAPLGFAYVGVFETPPPIPADLEDRVRYDDAHDRIYTDRYTVGFGPTLPNHVAFVENEGDLGENVLARLRLHGDLRVFGNLVHLERGDEHVQGEFHGWKDGPVRVIRRAQYWIPLPLGFRAQGRVDISFYRDYVEGAAQAKIRIPPRLVAADGELLAYFDFRGLEGARLLTASGGPTDPVDSVLTPAQRARVGEKTEWAGLILADGTGFLMSPRLEGSLARLGKHLYFDVGPPVEGRPGRKPSFGYRLTGARELETGEPEFAVAGILVERADPESLRAAAEHHLHPPDVKVRRLPAS